jgi:TPR repeat protein
MYATGQGVPQDYVLADMWFNLAAAAGNADGDKSRTDVETLMTPEQIVEAKRRASEWKPSKP